jgi:hypothetical protein
MTNTDPILQTFYDGITGETITREVTPEEITELSELTEPLIVDESYRPDQPFEL